MGMNVVKDSIDLGIVSTNGPAMLAFYRDVLGLKHEGDLRLPFGTMHRLLCGTTVVKIVVPEQAKERKVTDVLRSCASMAIAAWAGPARAKRWQRASCQVGHGSISPGEP